MSHHIQYIKNVQLLGIITLLVGMLKINRLTGLQGKTGPETVGPVNPLHAAILFALRARSLRYIFTLSLSVAAAELSCSRAQRCICL